MHSSQQTRRPHLLHFLPVPSHTGRKPKKTNTIMVSRQQVSKPGTAPCLSAEGRQSAGPACRIQPWLASDRRTHTHTGKRHCKSLSGSVHCGPKYSIVVSRTILGVKKQTVSQMQSANYIGSEGRRREWRKQDGGLDLNKTSESTEIKKSENEIKPKTNR